MRTLRGSIDAALVQHAQRTGQGQREVSQVLNQGDDTMVALGAAPRGSVRGAVRSNDKLVSGEIALRTVSDDAVGGARLNQIWNDSFFCV